MDFLSGFSKQAYALMRIFAGAMFAFHGAQKIFGLFAAAPKEMFTQLWFGGLIELVGGILIMIGLFTSFAAFVCSGMMAVAYFQFHWKFQFSEAFFPINNGGELAVLYCFVFLYIATRGGVAWCVDKVK
jgi:putative oxidoreductase